MIQLLLLTLLLPPAVQDPTEALEPAAIVAGKNDADALAKEFTEAWDQAVYVISNGNREVGAYLQKNLLSLDEEEKVLQYADGFAFPKQGRNYTFFTACDLTPTYPVRGVMANLDFGNVRMRFADGRVKGMQLGQVPLDQEVPDTFQTCFTILRGLADQQFEKGWEQEYDYVNIRNIPEKGSVTKGVFRCIGSEELVIEDEAQEAWKFRFDVVEERPVFLWFTKEGHLLKRLQRKETWIFSPSRTADQRREG